jgi:hypothetical protein
MLHYCDQRLLCGYCDVLVIWILTFVMTGVQISLTLKVNWWWQWSKTSTEEYNAPMILDFFDKHYYFFWVLMYMYNMLLRFEKKYSAIYEHNVFTVNIYFFMRISRVLCFFKHFLWFNLYKSDQFQFIISDFFIRH